MKLGKVQGKLWAERKMPSLQGVRLLVVQPITSDGLPKGDTIVAADPCNCAGSGDTVVIVTNTDAAEAFDTDVPVNASVVMLVDSIG